MPAGSGAYDACIVGSGPNGLAAAALLGGAGLSVLVLEGAEEIGGGMRTAPLTIEGFRHDVCSAAHPMGILSPYFTTLPLAEHGLRWLEPPASVAHPLDGEPAVLLKTALDETARELGPDGPAYRRLLAPFLKNPRGLLKDALGPLSPFPSHPFLMARFGLLALRSATGLARSRFDTPRAQALLAGLAGHSILPLERALTGALGLMFAITGHVRGWPVAAGGTQSIARALESYLKSLGVDFRTNFPVRTFREIPPARAILFDTSPAQLAAIAGDQLPAGYLRRLGRYRYGPGVFKVDWALDGPIPWRDPRCLEASTVHLGGTLEEIAASEAAVWRGEHPDKPYMILVQQSQFDDSRAPAGKHTGYAYCHVPAGSLVDLTDTLERQVERFAPGFRDLILARSALNTADLEAHNPNYLGGAITGGVADIPQAFLRPVARLSPYRTPNPRIYLCSASTPPGGGVHGMCGYHAAKSLLRRLGLRPAELAG